MRFDPMGREKARGGVWMRESRAREFSDQSGHPSSRLVCYAAHTPRCNLATHASTAAAGFNAFAHDVTGFRIFVAFRSAGIA